MRGAIDENRRLAMQGSGDSAESRFGDFGIIQFNLGMKRAAAKSVPRLLSQEKNQFRPEVAQDFVDTTDSDPFKKRHNWR